MKIITPKQRIVLKAIKSFIARIGKSPSIKELQEEMAGHGLIVKSTRSVLIYLRSLEGQGFIKRSSKSRGISLISENKKQFMDIPIYGFATAGDPYFIAEQNVEGYLKVPSRFAKGKNLFAIQVFGKSMDLCNIDGKSINDGDYILVDHGKYDLGDKVLAIVDGLAVVKTLRKVNDEFLALMPESSDRSIKPIYLVPKEDNFMINGKVVTVLRSPPKKELEN